MPDTPIAISPLFAGGRGRPVDGWLLADDGTDASSPSGVRIEDLNHLAKITVQASDEDHARELLGTRHGRALSADGRLTVGAAPREWFIIGAPGAAAGVVDEVEAAAGGNFITATDVTHGRCLVRLSGPTLENLLPRLTAMDLDDDFVPNGSALRTSVLGVVCDLVRLDHDGARSYLLHCERSSGRYLIDEIRLVGAEFGVVVVPGTSPG